MGCWKATPTKQKIDMKTSLSDGRAVMLEAAGFVCCGAEGGLPGALQLPESDARRMTAHRGALVRASGRVVCGTRDTECGCNLLGAWATCKAQHETHGVPWP
jgi:hypothetical protein